ncbi:MAG: thiol reductant ABC exporter subunit CydD [Nocardioides sp.]|uniref:thiol reductant ABC exporter subunit CydD n=1 Tax=Nocardioides sp. TaxID=35761 RepID=UPI0039E286B8
MAEASGATMRPGDPRLRRQLAPARGPLVVVIATGALGSALLVAQAWAVTHLLLAVFDSGTVWGWALGVVAVFLARGLIGWIGDLAAARAAGLVGRDLRRRVLGAILARPGATSGSLAALATRGVTAAEPYLTRYFPAMVIAGIGPVLVLAAIAVLDPTSGLVVLVTLPLIPVFGILVGLATRDRAASQWRAMSTLSGHFLDVVRGLPTLVAYGRARAQSSTIRAVTDTYRRRSLATLRIAFASGTILELVATISVALVAVTVGVRLAAGHLSLETALIVLLLAPEAYWPLRRVGTEFHAAAEGVATFEAAAELTGADPAEAPEAPGPGEAGPDPAPGLRSGEPIRLQAASVTYPGRSWPALVGVDELIATPGVTAVTGPSGAGKSTLLALLAGLIDPTSGWVRRPAAEQIAWLPQRPVFLAGSVADNLRLAAPQASDAELWQALAEVALADRVRALPGGLDSELGEDGMTLSAGERARLALARVLVSDREWVFLDEPTAHLDPETEQVIADVVARLGRSRGVVLVAHRDSLVDLADRVIELALPVIEPPGPVEPVEPPASAETTPPVESPASVQPPASIQPAALVEPVETSPPGRRGRLWAAAALGGLASTSGVALTALAGWLIVKASYQPGILTLVVAMVGVRTFGLARPVLHYVERLWSHDEALRLLAVERVRVYDAMVPLVPGALPRRRGDLLAGIVDDVDAVLDDELRVRLPVRAFAVTAVIASLGAALISPPAAAVIAAGALVGGAGAFTLARCGVAAAERRLVSSRATLSEAIVEAAQTAAELRMWQAERPTLARVDDLGRQIGRAGREGACWLGMARALILTLAGCGVAAVAWLAPVDSGPVLTLLALIPLALAEPAGTMADAGAARARTHAARRRLDELTRLEPAVREPAEPLTPADPAGALELAGVGVRRGGHEALADLDLAVPAGGRVAVVGPSGSGKSTLAGVLLRFWDPATGEVRLDGQRLDALELAAVRGRVGLVDDDPHIFASSLAENVRLARPGSGDDALETALRQAHLGDWLDRLPGGLATRIGDGGADVSGGERARIAIARSILADQPVLVLDEPVAHLDTPTAQALAAEVLDRAADEHSGHPGGPGRPGRTGRTGRTGHSGHTGDGERPGRTVVWITHAEAGLDRVDQVIRLEPSGSSPRRHPPGWRPA